MSIQIEFTADQLEPRESTALIAFLVALGGEKPATVDAVKVGITVDSAAMAEALRDAAQVVRNGADPLPSEQLIAQAAAQASALPPPAVAEELPEVDADGIPWDERIHSSSKAIVADGTWRKKRGVNEVYFGEVVAELQAAQEGEPTAPPAPPAPPAPEVASAPVPPPPPVVENAPTAEAPPAAASAPVAGEAPPPPPAPSSDGQFAGYADFVGAVSKLGAAYVQLNELATDVSGGTATKFQELKDRSDLWDMFYLRAEATFAK